jgi:hypothetical protein
MRRKFKKRNDCFGSVMEAGQMGSMHQLWVKRRSQAILTDREYPGSEILRTVASPGKDPRQCPCAWVGQYANLRTWATHLAEADESLAKQVLL